MIWPYQFTFIHENCIVTACLKPSDKIVRYKSNIQTSQNLKPKAIRKSQNYESASEIEFLKTYPPIIFFVSSRLLYSSLLSISGLISLIHRASPSHYVAVNG